MGEPPEDKLSDASNSPDYRNVSSPEDNTRDNKVSSVHLLFHSHCNSCMDSFGISVVR